MSVERGTWVVKDTHAGNDKELKSCKRRVDEGCFVFCAPVPIEEELSEQCLYVMTNLCSQFDEIKNEPEDSPLDVSVMMFSMKIL